jgi:hypothetical protein
MDTASQAKGRGFEPRRPLYEAPLRRHFRCDDPIEPNEPVRANYVGYIYGDCSIASGDEACAPPLEVQVWPACIRNHSTYQLTPTPGSQLPHRRCCAQRAWGGL